MKQEKLLKISDELLDLLLEFKNINPEFTFPLRERDSPQAKDVKRLESGQWFQGSDYIYVPLFRKGDNARNIKKIETNIESNFFDYLVYIIVLWFYPIGIIIVQPKLNKLYTAFCSG